MPIELYQLIYSSTYQVGRVDSPLQALRDIVRTSIKNNARGEVTGFLIFDGSTFLQILEGRRSDVIATYERIALDLRHRSPKTLFSRSIEQRDFSGWAMGGVLRTAQIPEFAGPDEAVTFAKRSMTSETPVR